MQAEPTITPTQAEVPPQTPAPQAVPQPQPEVVPQQPPLPQQTPAPAVPSAIPELQAFNAFRGEVSLTMYAQLNAAHPENKGFYDWARFAFGDSCVPPLGAKGAEAPVLMNAYRVRPRLLPTRFERCASCGNGAATSCMKAECTSLCLMCLEHSNNPCKHGNYPVVASREGDAYFYFLRPNAFLREENIKGGSETTPPPISFEAVAQASGRYRPKVPQPKVSRPKQAAQLTQSSSEDDSVRGDLSAAVTKRKGKKKKNPATGASDPTPPKSSSTTTTNTTPASGSNITTPRRSAANRAPAKRVDHHATLEDAFRRCAESSPKLPIDAAIPSTSEWSHDGLLYFCATCKKPPFACSCPHTVELPRCKTCDENEKVLFEGHCHWCISVRANRTSLALSEGVGEVVECCGRKVALHTRDTQCSVARGCYVCDRPLNRGAICTQCAAIFPRPIPSKVCQLCLKQSDISPCGPCRAVIACLADNSTRIVPILKHMGIEPRVTNRPAANTYAAALGVQQPVYATINSQQTPLAPVAAALQERRFTEWAVGDSTIKVLAPRPANVRITCRECGKDTLMAFKPPSGMCHPCFKGKREAGAEVASLMVHRPRPKRVAPPGESFLYPSKHDPKVGHLVTKELKYKEPSTILSKAMERIHAAAAGDNTRALYYMATMKLEKGPLFNPYTLRQLLAVRGVHEERVVERALRNLSYAQLIAQYGAATFRANIACPSTVMDWFEQNEARQLFAHITNGIFLPPELGLDIMAAAELPRHITADLTVPLVNKYYAKVYKRPEDVRGMGYQGTVDTVFKTTTGPYNLRLVVNDDSECARYALANLGIILPPDAPPAPRTGFCYNDLRPYLPETMGVLYYEDAENNHWMQKPRVPENEALVIFKAGQNFHWSTITPTAAAPAAVTGAAFSPDVRPPQEEANFNLMEVLKRFPVPSHPTAALTPNTSKDTRENPSSIIPPQANPAPLRDLPPSVGPFVLSALALESGVGLEFTLENFSQQYRNLSVGRINVQNAPSTHLAEYVSTQSLSTVMPLAWDRIKINAAGQFYQDGRTERSRVSLVKVDRTLATTYYAVNAAVTTMADSTRFVSTTSALKAAKDIRNSEVPQIMKNATWSAAVVAYTSGSPQSSFTPALKALLRVLTSVSGMDNVAASFFDSSTPTITDQNCLPALEHFDNVWFPHQGQKALQYDAGGVLATYIIPAEYALIAGIEGYRNRKEAMTEYIWRAVLPHYSLLNQQTLVYAVLEAELRTMRYSGVRDLDDFRLFWANWKRWPAQQAMQPPQVKDWKSFIDTWGVPDIITKGLGHANATMRAQISIIEDVPISDIGMVAVDHRDVSAEQAPYYLERFASIAPAPICKVGMVAQMEHAQDSVRDNISERPTTAPCGTAFYQPVANSAVIDGGYTSFALIVDTDFSAHLTSPFNNGASWSLPISIAAQNSLTGVATAWAVGVPSNVHDALWDRSLLRDNREAARVFEELCAAKLTPLEKDTILTIASDLSHILPPPMAYIDQNYQAPRSMVVDDAYCTRVFGTTFSDYRTLDGDVRGEDPTMDLPVFETSNAYYRDCQEVNTLPSLHLLHDVADHQRGKNGDLALNYVYAVPPHNSFLEVLAFHEVVHAQFDRNTISAEKFTPFTILQNTTRLATAIASWFDERLKKSNIPASSTLTPTAMGPVVLQQELTLLNGPNSPYAKWEASIQGTRTAKAFYPQTRRRRDGQYYAAWCVAQNTVELRRVFTLPQSEDAHVSTWPADLKQTVIGNEIALTYDLQEYQNNYSSLVPLREYRVMPYTARTSDGRQRIWLPTVARNPLHFRYNTEVRAIRQQGKQIVEHLHFRWVPRVLESFVPHHPIIELQKWNARIVAQGAVHHINLKYAQIASQAPAVSSTGPTSSPLKYGYNPELFRYHSMGFSSADPNITIAPTTNTNPKEASAINKPPLVAGKGEVLPTPLPEQAPSEDSPAETRGTSFHGAPTVS
jgi:hypothetical protein